MTSLRRIGEVPAATGLTVRTLHHYDEIGLLAPSGRSEAGYRLYADDDVRRLYRIVAFRPPGFRPGGTARPVAAGGGNPPPGTPRRLERPEARGGARPRPR